jgi:zinc protease
LYAAILPTKLIGSVSTFGPFLRNPRVFTTHSAQRSALGLAIALIVTSESILAAELGSPKKIATVEGITEYQLDNGLRVLLYPDSSRPTVTVNMVVLVGSRHEGYGETGMAHLLEHMLFKGTADHPSIPKVLQDHGAQFNATTSDDRTNYFETVPASNENLEYFLYLEADRLVNSFVRKSDLDFEMTVVRNEFERGENSPSNVLSERISAAAYDFHNYGKPTIGNRSDIERVPIEKLQAFYHKYYQPDNVVLVIAGQFDESKALELVQKYFGAIPRPQRKLDTTYTEEPAQDGERNVILRRVGEVGIVGAAYHIPAGSHEDAAALQVLGSVLSSQPSGRLYKALVETKKATNAFARSRGEHDPGLFVAMAEVRDPATLTNVRDDMTALVESIGSQGVTDEEVQRAKQQILKARERAAANTSQFALSLTEWIAEGDWRLYFLHRDRIENVTPAQVKDVAAKYLLRNNRTVGMFIPTDKPERVAVPATPDVKALVENYQGRKPISAGETFDATLENIEARVKRVDLPEGIKATLLAKKTRGDEAHLLLTLRYGNENNLKGFEPAAGLLPDLMLRGTKKLSHQELRDQLDKLGATISASSGSGPISAGMVRFSVQAKRDTLPAVLELLKQVLREPLLPEDKFEEMKRQRLADMEQSRTEPSVLASRELSRSLAPYSAADVRYVPTIDESIDRMKNVKYAEVEQLYRDYLGSQAGELSIVGDFDPNACLPILQEALSGWKATKPYSRIAMKVPGGLTGGKHSINTPDKANATFVAGMLFPMRDDDSDYPAMEIADYLFGGSTLSSRLGDRVRQKEGLSYGVTSNLNASAFDERAGFSISAICNPLNIEKVETAIKEELDKLLADGVTQEELDRAKQGYLQSQKVRRTSDVALSATLSELSHQGRTMKFIADLERKISELTPEQVAVAVQKHLHPQDLIIVRAGDFKTKSPAADNR